jgi:hypothetical protein
MDCGNIGMIERCEQPGFTLEAGHSFRIGGEQIGKELERDPPYSSTA